MQTLVVTFTDGTETEHRCERYEVREGVLSAWYDGPSWSGGRRDLRNWPLEGNVREFHWKDE
jgi:hypothetical protein